jgi:heme/copper-type cytochrome/quinol oxidase subunit 2
MRRIIALCLIVCLSLSLSPFSSVAQAAAMREMFLKCDYVLTICARVSVGIFYVSALAMLFAASERNNCERRDRIARNNRMAAVFFLKPITGPNAART